MKNTASALLSSSGSAYLTTDATFDASKITTGTLALSIGGTNANLSATGGTGQYLKQQSAGAAVTVGTIAMADLGTGAPSSSNFLRGDGSWQAVTATANPGGSSGQVQYNNAGAFGGETYFVRNSAGSYTLQAGATGTVPLSIVMASGQTASPLLIQDSSSNLRFWISATGQTYQQSDSVPFYQCLYRGTPSAFGTWIGALLGGAILTGSTNVASGHLSFYSDGAWSSTSAPTLFQIALCPPGSTTRSARVGVGSSGDVWLNYTGSALATTATGGFVHVTSIGGAPTGTPSNLVTGATPATFDTSNASQWAYFGGWKLVGATGGVNAPAAQTTSVTMSVGQRLLAASPRSGLTLNVTLPTAANYQGSAVYVTNQGIGTVSVTYANGTLSLATNGGATFVSDGTNWYCAGKV